MSSARIRATIDKVQLYVGNWRWGGDASKLRGVRGWLLLLCITLSIILPLRLFAGFESFMKVADASSKRFPVYSMRLRCMEIADLFFCMYSLYVGVELWKVRKGAVSKAKLFLLVYLAYNVARTFSPCFSDLNPEIRDRFVGIFGRAALQCMVATAVWHQYLARSVRVKNTFFMREAVPNQSEDPTP